MEIYIFLSPSVSPGRRHFGCVGPFQRRTLCHGYVQFSVHVGLPEEGIEPRKQVMEK
ncbi:hypothetical protein [uncultured Fibrobacter sp.]|uniref:hypothetical protein n=1 Tax=uncultured Fibrobacter sp. TaxID=261512 RepID=UPI002803EA9C|nr:hypothetical protein [uncultured Fibrobacter sp.]